MSGTSRDVDELVTELLVRGDAIGNVRRLANAASAIAFELRREVAAAQYDGRSWEAIATAARGRWPSGAPAAIGDLFPGGASTTTVRRFYS